MKYFLIIVVVFALSACDGCYRSYEDAWAACNSKYNGKCKYLGKNYEVCKGGGYD